MQVIIEVDEDTIKSAKRDGLFLAPRYRDDLTQAIRNCIVLPAGHGRLIDADVLVDGMEDDYEFCETVNATPTIIEADGGAE